MGACLLPILLVVAMLGVPPTTHQRPLHQEAVALQGPSYAPAPAPPLVADRPRQAGLANGTRQRLPRATFESAGASWPPVPRGPPMGGRTAIAVARRAPYACGAFSPRAPPLRS